MAFESLRNDPNYLAGVEQAFLANTRRELLADASDHDRRLLLTESIHWAERTADYFFRLAGVAQLPPETTLSSDQIDQAA